MAEKSARSIAQSANRIALAGGLLTLVGYAAIARGVDNFYPFSVFSMYAQQGSSGVSRLGARGTDGVMHDVQAFDRWHCVAVDRSQDGQLIRGFEYLDREARNYLAGHTVSSPVRGAEPVDLVNREWQFVPGRDAPETRDVVVSNCTALRGGPGSSVIAIDAFHTPHAGTVPPR